MRFLNGTLLDERPIRVDHDWGFVDGRQWGRGNSGGQVRLPGHVTSAPRSLSFGLLLLRRRLVGRQAHTPVCVSWQARQPVHAALRDVDGGVTPRGRCAVGLPGSA